MDACNSCNRPMEYRRRDMICDECREKMPKRKESVTITEEQFIGAFAQAFCTEKNKNKQMDPDLGMAIADILFNS